MKEALMGIETEYCTYCDIKQLEQLLGNSQTYVNFALKQIGSVLPKDDFWVRNISGEFWTRAGMRCYADCSKHIEIATPECGTFEELIFQKNVGDRLVQALVDKTRDALRSEYKYGGPFAVYGNNTALDFELSKGDTSPGETGEARGGDKNNKETAFARHENYLLRKDMLEGIVTETSERQLRFILENAGLFFISRPVIGGPGHLIPGGRFVLSPRSGWTENSFGGATTSSRSIVNTRDEPHCDRTKFIRYHHIAGDTNITDHIMRMKMAFTYWVLRLLERGWKAPSWLYFNSQMGNDSYILNLARAINCDTTLTAVHQLQEKKTTAVDILYVYLEAVDKNRDVILFEEEDGRIFSDVAAYLDRAKKGYKALVGESEWATKYSLLLREMRKKNLKDFDDPRLRMLSIVLHNLDKNPKQNPFAEFRANVLPGNLNIGDLVKACRKAPRTRAYVRGLAMYLAKKLGVNINFGPNGEWGLISLPASRDGSLSYTAFELNAQFPWELRADDIKTLVQLMKPRFMFPPDELVLQLDPYPYAPVD